MVQLRFALNLTSFPLSKYLATDLDGSLYYKLDYSVQPYFEPGLVSWWYQTYAQVIYRRQSLPNVISKIFIPSARSNIQFSLGLGQPSLDIHNANKGDGLYA